MDDALRPHVGHMAIAGARDVLDHFERCAACGQLVDGRDIAAVLHHDAPDHARLAEPDATRLVSLEDRLRVALLQATLDRRADDLVYVRPDR